MKTKKIISILNKELNLKKIHVTENNNHFQITAIGDIFKGLTEVKRQQIVYTHLIEMITENQIHAISISSYTIEEWDKKMKYIKK